MKISLDSELEIYYLKSKELAHYTYINHSFNLCTESLIFIPLANGIHSFQRYLQIAGVEPERGHSGLNDGQE